MMVAGVGNQYRALQEQDLAPVVAVVEFITEPSAILIHREVAVEDLLAVERLHVVCKMRGTQRVPGQDLAGLVMVLSRCCLWLADRVVVVGLARPTVVVDLVVVAAAVVVHYFLFRLE